MDSTRMSIDERIAKSSPIQPIEQIARTLGIEDRHLMWYGPYKGKIHPAAAAAAREKSGGKQADLILVSAMSPTPLGEGKTTVTIGLADALRRLGKKAVVALREPSLGPVFGVKGGATGGGKAQCLPMDDINLHFTGDLHAITAANNLLAALIDNHIFQGNKLGIDPDSITFTRCMDCNDRQLRVVESGLATSCKGHARQGGFVITAASEVMAVFCMADSFADLKKRLGDIVVARDNEGRPVRARDLNAQGAMAALLRDAIFPNLAQTLEGTPAIIHGGPFANIAHGCNSLAATQIAMSMADVVVTEAGFGADLGMEKFIDIKCRAAGIAPKCAVIVATCRALKYNSGRVAAADAAKPDVEALREGFANLRRHIENARDVFGLPAVVALNHFVADSDEEVEALTQECEKIGVECAAAKVWEQGGEGGLDLARKALKAMRQSDGTVRFAYSLDGTLAEKIETVAKRIYRADGVNFTYKASGALDWLEKHGFGGLPVCVAKTQYSFSDDPKALGAPTGFKPVVRDVAISNGAGFVVASMGDIMKMPGLPKTPAAETIDLSDDGEITGLF